MKIAIFLDDMAMRHSQFRRTHGKEYDIYHVWTFAEFFSTYMKISRFRDVDLVSLDHDLGDKLLEGTGMMAAETLALLPKELRPKKVVVHSWNKPMGDGMMHVLERAGYKPIREIFNGGKFTDEELSAYRIVIPGKNEEQGGPQGG